MNSVDWKWYNERKALVYETPTVGEIKCLAKNLLESVYNSSKVSDNDYFGGYVSCGGFTAYKGINDNEDLILGICFLKDGSGVDGEGNLIKPYDVPADEVIECLETEIENEI
jgi:hypothetical protein